MLMSQQLILINRIKIRLTGFLILLALFYSNRKGKINGMAINKR